MLSANDDQANKIVPGLKLPSADTNIEVVSHYVLSLAEHFAASPEHMAIAAFKATLIAAKDRLPTAGQGLVARALFKIVDTATVTTNTAGLNLAFVPGYVEDIVEDYLAYIYDAGLSQKTATIILTSIVEVYFKSIKITASEKAGLTHAIFRQFTTIN